MVDISDKEVTHREATATGFIDFSSEIPIQLIKEDNNKKGDVLSVSRIAGIMAVKRTSELIPLCHPIPVTKVRLNLTIVSEKRIKSECVVQCDGKTGVEMEALTGVNVSLLTVYDMCKATDKKMIINDCKVSAKTGGKSGDFHL